MHLWFSWLSAAVVAQLYVVVIYYQTPEGYKELERDDVRVVQFRMRRITALTVLLMVVVPLLVSIGDHKPWSEIIRYSGMIPGFTDNHSGKADFIGVCKLLLLICSLYIGPISYDIFYYCKYNGAEGDWDLFNDFVDNFVIIQGFRDHVFAPITEELVYRSMVLTLFHEQGKTWYTMYLTPLLFGIAHVHHGYQVWHKFGDEIPFPSIVLGTGFQSLYTALFGILTNHLFYKYHTVWSCIVVHAVCNLIGFPMLSKYRTHDILIRDSPDESTNEQHDDTGSVDLGTETSENAASESNGAQSEQSEQRASSDGCDLKHSAKDEKPGVKEMTFVILLMLGVVLFILEL